MNITETTVDGMAVAVISGRIDSATAAACEAGLSQSLAAGRLGMVLDLAEVDYLSSAGIRVLVLTYKRAAAAGIVLSLARPQEHVREVLEISGLEADLVVRPSIAAAIAAVRHADAPS